MKSNITAQGKKNKFRQQNIISFWPGKDFPLLENTSRTIILMSKKQL